VRTKAADALGDDVADEGEEVDLVGQEHGERDGRVVVAAGDRAAEEDHRGQRHADGDRTGRLACILHNDTDENERTDEFGSESESVERHGLSERLVNVEVLYGDS
jgi:hypothetical protein